MVMRAAMAKTLDVAVRRRIVELEAQAAHERARRVRVEWRVTKAPAPV
jgi:hypothetical protein